MEATGEVEDFLDKFRPPRLEDAGLEDCALPPEQIKEAFLKAATAVGSRATSLFGASEDGDACGEEGPCMEDPWPKVAESSDALLGITQGVDPPPGACSAENGGRVPEVMGGEVAAGLTEADERTDRLLGPLDAAEEEGKACVEGLQGMKIGDRGEGKSKNSVDEDDRENEAEGPTLVEGYI